ncbi:subtilase [Apiospora rasikravindrae]|uniref:Subtilase n=1 Tax=Apiospora rasikravindrae TaxID=990691 RepID=A0ABR1T4Z8_9PEZI
MSNTGKEEVTYKLGTIDAATAYTFSNQSYPDPLAEMNFVDSYATINLSESKVTLAPGARKLISVWATPPAVNATRLPVYSGYVTIKGTNGESLSLPYQGIAGSLRSTRVMDSTKLIVVGDGSWAYPPVNRTLTFHFSKPDSDKEHPPSSQPAAVARLTFGTPLVHIEAIKIGSGNVTLSNSTTNLGDILGSPQLWRNRGTSPFSWNGQLADKSYAPEGRYRFAVRALHVFGNEMNETDYDVLFTEDFKIRYR